MGVHPQDLTLHMEVIVRLPDRRIVQGEHTPTTGLAAGIRLPGNFQPPISNSTLPYSVAAGVPLREAPFAVRERTRAALLPAPPCLNLEITDINVKQLAVSESNMEIYPVKRM